MKPTIRAILLMGGEGKRYQQSTPKQFCYLDKQRIYQHTLDQLLQKDLFEEIILVSHPNWIDLVRKETYSSRCTVIPGGARRQESSRLGLEACPPSTDFVLIHDAVRPFLSLDLLEKHCSMVIHHAAIDTCIPHADTIVESEDGVLISSIPSRKKILRGQTPQTFSFNLIQKAHQSTQELDATDDCSLVYQLGHPIFIVRGEESNIKITTQLDLKIAEFIHSCSVASASSKEKLKQKQVKTF